MKKRNVLLIGLFLTFLLVGVTTAYSNTSNHSYTINSTYPSTINVTGNLGLNVTNCTEVQSKLNAISENLETVRRSYLSKFVRLSALVNYSIGRIEAEKGDTYILKGELASLNDEITLFNTNYLKLLREINTTSTTYCKLRNAQDSIKSLKNQLRIVRTEAGDIIYFYFNHLRPDFIEAKRSVERNGASKLIKNNKGNVGGNFNG